MQIINHYSLLILALIILAAAAYLLLRKGFKRQNILILAGILAGFVLLWLIIRPRPTPAANPMELYSQIGMGTPVLVEFQSPY
jgi:hypothetical protein